MKYHSRQCPASGPRPCRSAADPRRLPARFWFITLLTLLVNLHGMARASAAELPLPSLGPQAADAMQRGIAAQAAQLCALSDDASMCEFPAVEAESNEDPASPDAPGVAVLSFRRAAAPASTGSRLHAACAACTTRLVASPVLARAPPQVAL